ncbi:MAG: menaquinone biosynthesis protein [Deltaproteobacteria bacterium]|nr:menaquinone biosynthesis protein [Deltaproteobacteria bacterium]
MTMLRMGRISFSNVMPVYYGIDNNPPMDIEIITDVPSALNQLMAENRLDISPVSTAAYAKNFRNWLILPDLSISCFGPVMSVRLACRMPIKELDGRHILLSRDSGAAAALVKWILFEKGISARFHSAAIDSPEDVADDAAAALVIGNAALSPAWDASFPHVYDLGEEWKKMKNLPFVFAIWAVRRAFAAAHWAEVTEAVNLLHGSRIAGINQIRKIARLAAHKTGITNESANLYFSRLSYTLGKHEIAGLSAFFSCLAKKGLICCLPEISFFNMWQP